MKKIDIEGVTKEAHGILYRQSYASLMISISVKIIIKNWGQCIINTLFFSFIQAVFDGVLNMDPLKSIFE